MPRELPGFYFDEEKKRYFPIKGPIPGSSRKPKPRSPPASPKAAERKRVKTSKLFLERELNGSRILVNKRKCNFAEEFHKLNASQPTIWKYKGTENVGDGALAQLPLVIQTPEGQNEMDALITGGINGVLSFYEVGKARQHNDGVRCVPDRVSKNKNIDAECSGVPGDIWRPTRALYQMSSSISCIRSFGYKSGRAMLTTLGAGTDGGCIKILNLVEPLDFTDSPIIAPMISGIASFNCTIWTGDCKPNSGQSVIGTNLGVSLLDLETGASSWVCRGKSDVLALQFNDSENIVLCGLRNGAILTIDVRERTEGVSSRLVRHRLPYSPSNKLGKTKQWFELKGHISPSDTIFMPSSVCSLVSLQSYDQYFLASAMDGSVKLYDHRMAKRGAVQCYEGHVNSHTRLQLGVDWSERFLAAGGEDCNLRMWSIKSGELLFEQQSSTSAPLTTCFSSPVGVAIDELHLSRQDNGLWFGSREGLFYSSW